jgi:hypothetical protein
VRIVAFFATQYRTLGSLPYQTAPLPGLEVVGQSQTDPLPA